MYLVLLHKYTAVQGCPSVALTLTVESSSSMKAKVKELRREESCRVSKRLGPPRRLLAQETGLGASKDSLASLGSFTSTPTTRT